MEFFTKDLVSNAPAQLFSDKTVSCFTIFLPEQLNLEGAWEVTISEKSYPSLYWKATEGKIIFFQENISNPLGFYFLEPGLHPSVTDSVEAKNPLF